LRLLFPPVADGPLELVDVELPAGAEVACPADAYMFIHQQTYMLEGELQFREAQPIPRASLSTDHE
jgi:hypothetical protein